ncbi:hypothetical protein [Stigmatella aurantiaca]|nr:hypothetical protein [Stigmatella aurantiaca]
MKKIIHAIRNYRLFRPMSFEEAKALYRVLSESMVRSKAQVLMAASTDESSPFRLNLHAVKTCLTKGSLRLHSRFLLGSKKEQVDILMGCMDARFERMAQAAPNGFIPPPQGENEAQTRTPIAASRAVGSPTEMFAMCAPKES